MKNILLFIFLLLQAVPAFASVPEKKLEMKAGVYISDKNLKELAIEKGIIPKDVNEQEELDKKNTVILWILQPRESKTNIIDFLKQTYKKDGVIIQNPTEFYIDEINTVLYNSFLSDNVFGKDKKGIGVIFKSIAIMDGDYDNGENKMKLLEEWVQPDVLERLKELFPEKIEGLQNEKTE